MEITAKIHKIYPVESKPYQDKVFKSQVFTLVSPHKDNPKYDKYPAFVVKKDNPLEALSFYKEGDTVTVSFEMTSREWNGKVYPENEAWKLAGNKGNQSRPSTPQATNDSDQDNLPF